MVGNITGLYANYIYKQDRRQQSTPVEFDRRSGLDRRSSSRPTIDPKLKHDIDQTKNIFAALSPITPIRRISSLPDNIKEGNYTRAVGLLGLAYANFPEDTVDLKNACKQIFKGELPKYDYKNYQAPFSFLRGTALEPVVNKMGKLGVKLHQWDVSLFDTRFGKFISKLFKISYSDFDFTGRSISQVTLEKGKAVIKNVNVLALKPEGTTLSKLIGRTLLRIPVMSVIALSLLELPSIIKSFSKNESKKENIEDGSIQILKSGINVTSILSAIGLCGAIFAGKGPAFSLLGMGLGSLAGNFTSKQLAQKIDKIRN